MPAFHRIKRKDGLQVGWVVGLTFYKRLRGSVHKLQKPPAWAFDTATLNRVLALGATHVTILDLETGTRYSAPLARVKERGVRFDRGHNPQIYLYIKHWDVSTKAERRPAPLTTETQPALFELGGAG